MKEVPREREPKISDLEVIIILPILVFIDILSIILLLVGVDDFWIMDILIGIPLAVYYYHKGFYGSVKAARKDTKEIAEKFAKKYLPIILAQFGGELIPYVGALPLYSGVFIWIVYKDRHPEVEALTNKLGGLSKAKSGGARGVAQAEGRAAEAAGEGAGREIGGAATQQTAGGGATEGEGGASGKGGVAAGQTSVSASATGESEAGDVGEGGYIDRESGHGQDEAQAGKPLSLEERRLENAIRGRAIEDVMEDVFGADQMLADVDTPVLGAKVLKFDPNRAIQAKPAKEWPAGDKQSTKGIIDSEQVDLKKKRELLEDAA